MTDPEKPFRTDGCTLWPDGPWRGCCVEHDRVYWRGGTYRERLAADLALQACVAKRGHPIVGWVMFAGVQAFGAAILPTRWRWGHGYRWPRSGGS